MFALQLLPSSLVLFVFLIKSIECAEIGDSERIHNLFLGANSLSSYKLRNYFHKHCSSPYPLELSEKDLTSLLELPELNWDQTCTVVLNLLDMNYRTFLVIIDLLAEKHPKTLLPLLPKFSPDFKEKVIFNLNDKEKENLFRESGYDVIFPAETVSEEQSINLLRVFCAVFGLKNFKPQIGGRKIGFEGSSDESLILGVLHIVFWDTCKQLQTENQPLFKKFGDLVFEKSIVITEAPESPFKLEVAKKILNRIQSGKIYCATKSERKHSISVVLSNNTIFIGDSSREDGTGGILKFTFKSIDFFLIKSLILTDNAEQTLFQSKDLERVEPFHFFSPQRSDHFILRAWLMTIFITGKLLEVGDDFYRIFKRNLKTYSWSLISREYERVPVEEPHLKKILACALIKAFIIMNVKNNDQFPLPRDIPPKIDDSIILENSQEFYNIKTWKDLDYLKPFAPRYEISQEMRYSAMQKGLARNKKVTNGEVYLRDVLKDYHNRKDLEYGIKRIFCKLGLSEGSGERDPFLIALALVYFDCGKGLREFYLSLNKEQRAHVTKYANGGLYYTLMDIFCLSINDQSNPRISSKDLSSLLLLHDETDILSMFEVAQLVYLYSKFLFLQVDSPTISTHYFLLVCFEHSSHYTEENYFQMMKIANEVLKMPALVREEENLRLEVSSIADPGAYENLNFRFNWIKSIFLKILESHLLGKNNLI